MGITYPSPRPQLYPMPSSLPTPWESLWKCPLQLPIHASTFISKISVCLEPLSNFHPPGWKLRQKSLYSGSWAPSQALLEMFVSSKGHLPGLAKGSLLAVSSQGLTQCRYLVFLCPDMPFEEESQSARTRGPLSSQPFFISCLESCGSSPGLLIDGSTLSGPPSWLPDLLKHNHIFQGPLLQKEPHSEVQSWSRVSKCNLGVRGNIMLSISKSMHLSPQ